MATTVQQYTNQRGELLKTNPVLLETVRSIAGINIIAMPDSRIAPLSEKSHKGHLANASDYLEASARWDGWKTIKTWLKAGSRVDYVYGENLDLLLVEHFPGKGFQAYKGYSILG